MEHIYRDPAEASRRLHELNVRVSTATLAKYRWLGIGPPFQYFGRNVRYRDDRLVEYAKSRMSEEQRKSSTGWRVNQPI